MRHPSAVRRTSALVSATAVLSAVGLSSGLFVGVALAAPTGVTPSSVINSTTAASTFTLSGSGFLPTDTVKLVPTVVPYASELSAMTISGTTSPTSTTTSSLVFTATVTNAAPEAYNVVVTQGLTSSTCSSCLFIANPGRPTVGAVAGSNGTFTVAGTNIAKGAKVEFLKADDATVDTAMTWTPGTDSSTTHTTGYTSSSSLLGTYTSTAAATPGMHFLRVTNTDGQQSKNNSVQFWQPAVDTIFPGKLGQGATNIPVTATGSGIRAGSSMSISQFSSSTSDITVGTATTTGTTSVTAPVTVSTAATSNLARTVSVSGPDGGVVRKTGALLVTLAPTITAQSVNPVGQGGTITQSITGTYLQTGVAFTGSTPGVTFTTTSVAADGTSATVAISATPTATVGDVTSIVATNPDHGTVTYTSDGTGIPAPLGMPALTAVDAAPQITSISPSSVAAGSGATVVTLKGTGFDTAGMTASFVSHPVTAGAAKGTITNGPVTVTNATTATVTITTPADAADAYDVILKNTADAGTSTCVQCFGIDQIGISPTPAANTNNSLDAVITAKGSTLLTGATKVVLSKRIAATDQPDITGTTPVVTDSTHLSSTFDLTAAAPGAYNVIVSFPSGPSVSCAGCFTVTGAPPTISAIASNKGGIGATDFPVTITGTNISHGDAVTIAGVTVSDVTFVDATTLHAKVTIPSTATAKSGIDVVISSASGSNTLTGGYSIVAAPTVTSPTQQKVGQGATTTNLAVVGTGFTAASTVTFSGTGVTAGTPVLTDDKHLTVPVAVSGTAPIGDVNLTVVQTDNGGRSAPHNAITVTAKPVPSLIAPSTIPAGHATPVKISGQGFQAGSAPQIADVTFTNVVLGDDGSLSATATVPASAAGGARTVKVNNPDGGTGSCTCKLTIGKPTSLTLTTYAINPGKPAAMIIKGTPGDQVQVFSKTAPLTTFSEFRTNQVITIGAGGTVQVPVTPRRNTQLVATDGGTASNVVLLNVRPAIALRPHVTGRAVSFTGSIVPGVGGARVRLFSVSKGQLTLQAETMTAGDGTFAFPLHTYSAPGKTVQFLAQTTSNANNISGQSPRANVTFGK